MRSFPATNLPYLISLYFFPHLFFLYEWKAKYFAWNWKIFTDWFNYLKKVNHLITLYVSLSFKYRNYVTKLAHVFLLWSSHFISLWYLNCKVEVRNQKNVSDSLHDWMDYAQKMADNDPSKECRELALITGKCIFEQLNSGGA